MAHGLGLKNIKDPGKHLFDKFVFDADLATFLAPSVSYLDKFNRTYNQGELGTCVSWGTRKHMEYEHAKYRNQTEQISSRAIYSGAKLEYAPNDLTDDGLNVSDGLNIIKQYYVDESDWPSTDDTSSNNFPEWVSPVPDNIKKKDFVIQDFIAVDTDITSIKMALSQNGPMTIGTAWANSWFDIDSSGKLPAPNQVAGGHCVNLVGYDDNFENLDGTKGAFIILNQWGNWADQNACYLPYSFYTNYPEFWPSDIYTLRAA